MPNFSIKDEQKQGFLEYFEIVTDMPLIPPEKPYLDELVAFVKFLGELPVGDVEKLPAGTAAIVRAKIPIRAETMRRLRSDAAAFCGGTLDPTKAMRRVLIQRGRYEAVRDRLEASLFVVEEKIVDGKAVDLDIRASSGGADNTVPPEKQALFVDLANARTVIAACCDRLRPKNPTRARDLLDEYVRKLAGCGRIGLQGDHPILAKAALGSHKIEFYSREAGSIKKRASEALFWRSVIIAIALAAPYFILRWLDQLCPSIALPCFLHERKEFFLLAAGAALGTWTSFSIRNLDLTFDDLGKLEDELLGPAIRIAFVVVLALTLGLVFWTKAFAISIGDMKVEPPIRGATALLVGIFCGLSERALATAISSRATAFVKGVGGGT
jgi:hypothetical protein